LRDFKIICVYPVAYRIKSLIHKPDRMLASFMSTASVVALLGKQLILLFALQMAIYIHALVQNADDFHIFAVPAKIQHMLTAWGF